MILTPNPLLLRTGRERRAGAAIVMARRRTIRWASQENPTDRIATDLKGERWLHT